MTQTTTPAAGSVTVIKGRRFRGNAKARLTVWSVVSVLMAVFVAANAGVLIALVFPLVLIPLAVYQGRHERRVRLIYDDHGIRVEGDYVRVDLLPWDLIESIQTELVEPPDELPWLGNGPNDLPWVSVANMRVGATEPLWPTARSSNPRVLWQHGETVAVTKTLEAERARRTSKDRR